MSSGAATDERAVDRASVPAEGGRRRTGRPETAGRTLVVGLGNPILGDDGVGWKVIDEFDARLARDPLTAGVGSVECDRQCVGGLSLMERLVDYDRAIVVDAVVGPERPGSVWSLPLEDVATRITGHVDSAHDVSLVQAIEAGRALGARLPDRVTVVGITVESVGEFAERLSPPVAGAIAAAVDAIVACLPGRPGRTD